MKWYFIFLVLHLGSIFNCTNGSQSTRDGKFIAALVSFPNDQCSSSDNSDVGVCFSKKKCTRVGGKNLGTCAHGYGTCCKFTAQCTATDDTVVVTRNQTTLVTPSVLPRTCTFSFPRQPGVCQIRLDFPQLGLNPPNNAGDCLTDYMSVSNTVTVDGLKICGNGASAARHMYLDYGASNGPIQVSLRTDGPQMGMLNNMYGYQIRTTQIKCDSSRRVPQDCLQYYTDVSGAVSSYNYAASMGQQLNNADYKVCIEKRNPGDRIQWTPCNGTTTMPGDNNGPVIEPSNMCLIGDTSAGCFPVPIPLDGSVKCNTDYVEIPGSTMGRYCHAMPPVGFPRSVTTTNFWLRVKFDHSEPPNAPMPIPLGPAPCNAVAYPITVPDYTLMVDPMSGNCVLQPNSMTADIQNAGFCLGYAIVPSSTPLGDVIR